MIIHLHVIISTDKNKVILRKLQECKPECSIISPNEIYQYNNIIHKGLTKPHKIFSKIEFVRVTFINRPQKEEAASCIRSVYSRMETIYGHHIPSGAPYRG